MRSHLLAIDGHNVLLRAHFGWPRGVVDPLGRTAHSLLGTCAMIGAAVRALGPTHVLVAFDAAGRGGRPLIDPRYKANRVDRFVPGDRPHDQIPALKRALDAAGVAWAEVPGEEADDVLASYAATAAEDRQVTVLSGDKDLWQTVGPWVRVATGRASMPFATQATVCAALGLLDTRQVLPFRAMVGDASDNLPGVYGVGPRTAGWLLRAHGDLDGVYDAAGRGRVRRAVADRLAAGRERAYLNTRLMRLRTDLPIDRAPTEAHRAEALQAPLHLLADLGLVDLAGFVASSADDRPLGYHDQQPCASALPCPTSAASAPATAC